MAIHDTLSPDVVRYVALLVKVYRTPYRTRSRVRAAHDLRTLIAKESDRRRLTVRCPHQRLCF